MLKIIPAILAVFALAAFLVLDFMGFKSRSHEIATLQEAGVQYDAVASDETPSYLSHLLAKVGMGEALPARSLETALATRMLLHSVPINSYLPQPDEDILPGWERISWSDDYHTGFGWPDGVNDPYSAEEAALEDEVAIYLKGNHSIYLRVQYAEPTKVLAERLKQSYWVVETGRDLGKLLEAKPRASYVWTNVQQSSKGASVENAKDIKHFAQFDGVYVLTGKNKTARRDEKMRYMFASLGGGITVKLRAHAPEAAIKEVLAEIDYQSLNQMQTLPSPLIAEGLSDFILETPEGWLEAKGSRAKDVPIVAFDAPKPPKAAKPRADDKAAKDDKAAP